MKNEDIYDSWKKCIKDLFEYQAPNLPNIFARPHCTTCAYWQLFGEHEMDVMSENMYDLYFDKICDGIKGDIDIGEDFKFFGFCKRYPPLPNSDNQFTVRPKPLFINAPKYMFEYKYPITDHQEWCGEWKRSKSYWCERSFLIEMADAYLKGEHLAKKGTLPESWEVFFQER